MFDVLVVGELNVDIILNQIDGFPEVGKEILAKNFTVTLGSSSAIFASNLSTLGAKTAFLGKVGDDQFADLIHSSLNRKKVDTGYVFRSAELKTGSTIVLNYGMDRANVTYPGAMESLTERDVRDDILTSAGHMHVSSVFLQPGIKQNLIRLFQRAKSFGLTTSLDPQWDPFEKWDIDLEGLLPYVDVFLPNRKELMCLTNTETVDDGINAIREFANVLAVKDGENGAILCHNGVITKIEAFLNEDVADCIGAGDSFDAGFISQFIKGVPLKECLKFANLAGAVNTTRSGGTKAFESLDTVKQIASERFSYSI
ncbi:MAG: carbohydrate kinase family protein [Cyclobacteriaceae bacterium]